MAKKIRLMTDAELKQVKKDEIYSETQTGPCFAANFCDDFKPLACSGVAGESCTTTWRINPNAPSDGRSLVAVTCGNVAYTCASGSHSGTGSASVGSGLPTDPEAACAGLPLDADCQWFNGISVQSGGCGLMHGRKMCFPDPTKQS